MPSPRHRCSSTLQHLGRTHFPRNERGKREICRHAREVMQSLPSANIWDFPREPANETREKKAFFLRSPAPVGCVKNTFVEHVCKNALLAPATNHRMIYDRNYFALYFGRRLALGSIFARNLLPILCETYFHYDYYALRFSRHQKIRRRALICRRAFGDGMCCVAAVERVKSILKDSAPVRARQAEREEKAVRRLSAPQKIIIT